MTDRRLKVGIVGAGFFGQVAHIAHYAEMLDADVPSCQIVGLAELRSDLRQQVAAKFAIPAAYETHHELLEQTDAEAVVVVTARAAMGPVVLDCLNAGKHVLTEKPLAGNSDLGARLVTAARQHSRLCVVGYMKRHDAGVQLAKETLEQLRASQELGAVTYIRAHCFAGDAYCGESDYIRSQEQRPVGLCQWPLAPEWLVADKHADYERYLNTYCHDVNLLRYLAGDTPNVRQARLSGDVGIAVLDVDGIPAVLETGLMNHAGWDEVVDVFFERGRLRIELPAPLLRDVPAKVELYRGDKRASDVLPVERSWAFRRQAQAFVADALSQGIPLASAEDAAHDLRLIEEIWRLKVK